MHGNGWQQTPHSPTAGSELSDVVTTVLSSGGVHTGAASFYSVYSGFATGKTQYFHLQVTSS